MYREYHPAPHDHQASRRPVPWRRVFAALLLCLAAGYAATGIYSVQPNQQAVVRRCGRVLPKLRGPGLHFGFPYGIDQVMHVKPLERKRVGVSMELADRELGRRVDPQQAVRLTGDRNLILVSAIVQYRLKEGTRGAEAYLFRVGDMPALVRNVAASTLSAVVASMRVDDVLTVERLSIQENVQRISQATLDRYAAGVQVTSVSLEGVAPPDEQVAQAFRDVTSAREDQQRAINEAQGYANLLLPQAGGEARRIRLQAEAESSEIVRTAEGEAARFTKMASQLGDRRLLTAKRLVLETLEEVLPRLRKVVLYDTIGEELDLGIFATNASGCCCNRREAAG